MVADCLAPPCPDRDPADAVAPLSGDLPSTLLAGVALVRPPLGPVGFLGAATAAAALDEFLDDPAEIGGELALISMVVFLPKHTLSLALGIVSPIIEPPDVVSSLGTGIKGISCPDSV